MLSSLATSNAPSNMYFSGLAAIVAISISPVRSLLDARKLSDILKNASALCEECSGYDISAKGNHVSGAEKPFYCKTIQEPW